MALGARTYGEPGCGYPSWTLAEEESRLLIRQAVEAGANFFDIANRASLIRKSAQVSAKDDETSGPGVDRRSRRLGRGLHPLRFRLVAERGNSDHDVRVVCLAVSEQSPAGEHYQPGTVAADAQAGPFVCGSVRFRQRECRNDGGQQLTER